MWNGSTVTRASLAAAAVALLVAAAVWITRPGARSTTRCAPPGDVLAVLHLQRAGWYEAQHLPSDAERAYDDVLALQCASLYATDRIGRLDLDRGHYQMALDTFLRVLSSREPGDASVIADARSGYVRAFEHVGRQSSARAAFQVVAPHDVHAMLVELADLYLADDRPADAIAMYRELIAATPGDRNACLWQHNVAHEMLVEPSASDDAKVAEIERLVATWSAIGARLPTAEAKDCHDNALAMADELARAYHRTQRLAFADRLYTAYLAAFADATDFAATQYFAAEARWSLAVATPDAAHWQRAAETFDRVVKTGGLEPTMFAEANYAAVLAWQNTCNNRSDAACDQHLLAALRAYRPYAPKQELPDLDKMAARLAAH